MAVSANSQCGRILHALEDGKWKSVASIHRKAGTSRLNSRISDLRIKHGYEIEHATIPGKRGALGHAYRLLGGPPIPHGEAPFKSSMTVPGDSYAPRDLFNRYRLYKVVYDKLQLLGTAPTPDDVGMAVVTLGLEGEFSGGSFGLLDTHGTEEETGTWVVNPWDTTPIT